VDTASGIAAASTDGPAAQAARVTGPQVSVCKFWVNTGRCAKGAQCPFLHTLLPAAGGVSRKTWVQKRYVRPLRGCWHAQALTMWFKLPLGDWIGEALPGSDDALAMRSYDLLCS
jgi:hypothetical protein